VRFELKLGAILGRNFDVTIGRAACEACSIYKFSLYLTGNISLLCYKHEPVNDV
jgi:hypothetical protein